MISNTKLSGNGSETYCHAARNKPKGRISHVSRHGGNVIPDEAPAHATSTSKDAQSCHSCSHKEGDKKHTALEQEASNH